MPNLNAYAFRFEIDGKEVPLPNGVWKEIVIEQNCEALLPSVIMQAMDNSGYMTHIMPFELATRVKLTMGIPGSGGNPDQGSDAYNEYEWRMFRAKPEAVGQYALNYIYTGAYDLPALHSPVHCRSFDTPRDAFQKIAEELEIGYVLDDCLPTDIKLVQSCQTNGEFLNWHVPRLRGKKNEGGFKAFIRVIKGKETLYVMSLETLLKKKPSSRVILGAVSGGDSVGMVDRFYTNYGVFQPAGLRQQDWGYYDDAKGVWVEEKVDIKKFPSINEFLKIHTDDPKQSQPIFSTGRHNEFDGFTKKAAGADTAKPFDGAVRGELWNRLMHLDKMWITTLGLSDKDCAVGSTIQVDWAVAKASTNPHRFQNCGQWMVERSLQCYSKGWRTRLLLTRPGIDRDIKGKLVKAENLVKQ